MFSISKQVSPKIPCTWMMSIAVLRIRVHWIRKILASWIRTRKNMRIQGAKYQPEMQKNYLLSKPKFKLLKKRDYKNFLISEWFIKF